MDTLFDRFFDFGNGMQASNYEPHINLSEQQDRFEVTAELPGLTPKDFSVEVKDNQLWISGEKKEEHEEKRKDIPPCRTPIRFVPPRNSTDRAGQFGTHCRGL